MIELIAEIGQAHEGSLGIAHSYIDVLASCKVNVIKWQMHIADAESSVYEAFRVKFSYEDDSRIDYWRRMEFTLEQWQGLKQHCEEKGIEFMCSPFSNAAVDNLESLNVKRYKIGSGEITNLLMLNKIAKTGKPIILSSGMSSFSELDKTIAYLKPFGNPLSVLQCTTSYPTNPDNWGLNVISELNERYQIPVGFSDHSGDIIACIAAAVEGAQILEFHAVFDKNMFGPDAKSSLIPSQIARLEAAVRAIEVAKNNPTNKATSEQFGELKKIFEKSLAVNANLKQGTIITLDMLEAKKPRDFGISASNFQNVVGKTLNKDKSQWDFLLETDLT